MTRCSRCGATISETSGSGTSGQCSRCGGEGDVSGETVRIETIAMAAAAPAPSQPSNGSPASLSASYSSRFHNTTTEDEGRFLPGTLIAGRYRMIELLGRGGMGEVYRATDLTLAQSVALKFLPNAADNLRLLERFHNEVRIARQVSHCNVCRVYDIGEAEGMPFISMEYVDGEDLGSLLQRIGRLPSDKALDISRKLCAGIAAAHDRGIIHRDLKPQNIMLNRRGEVVIMDFGLAAIADELRGAEARNGTPAYMSPEQLRGDVVTQRSDLYALGLIIYELFTGRRAYDARSLADLMQQQERQQPVSITSLVSDVDPGVEKVVLRCLQPNPANRPASALAVAAALPGGDPLAAALAAGEMPSPELVAASGKAEGIARPYAIACLVILLAGILAHSLVDNNISMLALAPAEYPVPVLEQKARDHVAALGHAPAVQDRMSWMQTNNELLRYLRDRTPGPKDWRKLLRGESPYRLFYRQSPTLLIAPSDGDIGTDRPPMNVPGMVMVVVDGNGRLRTFEAVVRSNEPGNDKISAEDVLRSAGLDLTKFTPSEPRFMPTLAFDKREAWTGMHPSLPDVKISAELATWRGLPVSFHIVWPFMNLNDVVEPPASPREIAFRTFGLLFVLTGLLCTIYYARSNLKRGRGDRKGALIVASAIAALLAARYLLGMHYMPSPSMIGHVFNNAAMIGLNCALFWLAYIALEPMVRATWPQSLVTWNRLLAGNWSDPRVCSHLLIGATVGVVVHYAFLLLSWFRMSTTGLPLGIEEMLYQGTRFAIGVTMTVISNAIITSLIIFFVMCGLKALLRKDWLAALVAAILLTLQESNVRDSTTLSVDLPIYVLVFATFAFMLLRMGMVPAIAGIVVINLLGRIHTGPEFLSWVNGPAAAQIIALVVLVIYAFWKSQSCPQEQKA
ncbi:MAG: serine/threonine protein kinase [Bryobacteraceae bacterium]|nr:serine/threonine protein kinase [Bryobacteraceae bacterium]